jgi:ribonuclease T1
LGGEDGAVGNQTEPRIIICRWWAMLSHFKRLIFLLVPVVGLANVGFSQTGQSVSHPLPPYSVSKNQAHIGGLPTIPISDLPSEARQTLKVIGQGGPFPYPKDGITFGNRERRLPPQRKGYYREYTVKTPHSRDRGARRIIAGSPGEFYYTDDHYNTFKLIKE